ncbi:hypothetical protein [Streptomyces sp. NPDC003480]
MLLSTYGSRGVVEPLTGLASLSAAPTTALAPETRARAKTVAGTIRADGAMVAARSLLDAID